MSIQSPDNTTPPILETQYGKVRVLFQKMDGQPWPISLQRKFVDDSLTSVGTEDHGYYYLCENKVHMGFALENDPIPEGVFGPEIFIQVQFYGPSERTKISEDLYHIDAINLSICLLPQGNKVVLTSGVGGDVGMVVQTETIKTVLERTSVDTWYQQQFGEPFPQIIAPCLGLLGEYTLPKELIAE